MVCRRTLKTRYEVLDLGKLPHFSAGPHCTLFGWQYWSLRLGFFACLPSSWSHRSHSVALTVVAQRSQLPSFSGMRHPPPLADGVSDAGDFQRELMTPEGRQESLSSAWSRVPVRFEPVLLPLPHSCFTPLRWRTQNAGGQPGLSASPAEGPSLALCCSCCRSAVWMSPALEESSCV